MGKPLKRMINRRPLLAFFYLDATKRNVLSVLMPEGEKQKREKKRTQIQDIKAY